MRVSKKVKKAMDKAKKEVLKNATNPKPKRKRVKKEIPSEPKHPSGRWIKDEWGNQGEVFFDGKLYWLVFLEPAGEEGIWNAVSRALDEKQWEEYKKKPLKTWIGQKSETSETGKQSSSTPRTTKSTKSSKKKPKKKSSTKSGKTATLGRQVKWQLTSTSPKK